MTGTRASRVSVLVATVLLALAGCSDDDTDSGQEASTNSTVEARGQTSATSDRSGSNDKPVATLGDPRSTGGGIEIYSLRRETDRLVTLRFALVNQGTEDARVDSRFGGTGSRSMEEVYLVDPDGLKRYLTVLDSEDRCLCSTNLFNVEPGERLEAFATFAAPPREVKAVTVVIPTFQPASNVPIES